MTRFLSRLVARERETVPLVRPRSVARFEAPLTRTSDVSALVENASSWETETTTAHQPEQTADPPALRPSIPQNMSVTPGDRPAEFPALPPRPSQASWPTPRSSEPKATYQPGDASAHLSRLSTDVPLGETMPALSPHSPLPQPLATSAARTHAPIITPAVSPTPVSPPPPAAHPVVVERHPVERPVLAPTGSSDPMKPTQAGPEQVSLSVPSPESPPSPIVSKRPQPPLEPPPTPATRQPPSADINPRMSFGTDSMGDFRRPQPVASPPTTTINVTIGRIKIKAHPKALPPRRSVSSAAPIMSLETYLQQRTGGQR